MLGNSVVVVVVRTRPRAIPLAMITVRKSTHGFPFLSHDAYGAPLSTNCRAVTIFEYSASEVTLPTVCQFRANTLLRKANGRVQI